MAGRPFGSKTKPQLRNYLGKDRIEKLTEKAYKVAMEDGDALMLKFLLEQVYGKAPQSMDITSGGEKITPILNGLSSNNSDKETSEVKKEDKGDSGRN